jgi:hypothetical protein
MLSVFKMTDYNELYKQLAQEVVNVEGNIGNDTAAFVQRFVDSLPAGKQAVTDQAKAELTAYLSAMQGVVSQGIVVSTALGLGEKVRVRNSLRSRRVLALAEQAFVERWNDDLTLSQRLWNWQRATESGVGDVLTKGVKTGESINKLIYDLQYNIEHNAAIFFDGPDAQVSLNGAKKFAVISNNRNKWTAELADSAKLLINNPQAQAQWTRTLKKAERYVDKLAETGTKHASLQLVNQLKAAVDKGRLELVDNSLKWWIYDKQLYNLKRIARTEMATATHRAVIDGTIDNEHIIGYQWSLSSSHKIFDICDYYASVDQGLGKGVWRKESVPRHKAHPHCMCRLTPRVTAIKEQGSESYGGFLAKLTDKQRQQLLPKWAQAALDDGIPLQKLLRDDGLGLVRKQDILSTLADAKSS